MTDKLIEIAKIGPAHGVKGEVKVILYSENKTELNFPRYFIDEAEIAISFRGFKAGGAIAKIENITDRDEAAKLRGKIIYISRQDLPELEDEDLFYIDDLIGLKIVNLEGKIVGVINNIQNHGAGDVINIIFNNGSEADYPFNKEFFPEIDFAQKIVTFKEADIV